jgi:predicted LPLAT superfamily acyltransferase/uncharacterized protein (DUF2062 family)
MQLKFAIVIPVFNHSTTVIDIIQRCLSLTNFTIIVVDDGSSDSVEKFYYKSQPENPQLHFITHQKNQGKGVALLTATTFAIKKGFTHMITLDADGQHFPEDVEKLADAAFLNPWSVILGDRQMQTLNVPKSSVFGKAFSNFWVKYETDLKVSDSQSGFRIYPLFYLQQMPFFSRRYDFEVEVLTRMIWKGVEIVSVPIQVKYFPPEKRITHFHKIKDNLRLVVLNTILVTTSLLKRNDSPFKSALAVAVGVFIGSLPIYGLHTLIAAALSFVFRVNFVYLFLGTQVSVPPMVPVLVFGASTMSKLILGHSPQGFFGLSRDWLIGIFALSTSLSVISGLVVYFIKKFKRPMKTPVIQQSRQHLGISILHFFLNHIGLRFVYFCLNFVVMYYFLFSFKARKSNREFVRVLNPQAGFLFRQKLFWKQLYTFAQILVDRGYQKMSTSKKFSIHEGAGVDLFKNQLSKTEGLIVLQSHFGGWEMSFNYFQHLKTQKKVSAVMYGKENTFQHTSIHDKTESIEKLKIEYYNEQSNTVSRLKNSLDQGHIVGMMGDRPIGRSYELIPLLENLFLVDTSALRLSHLCQVSVYSIFCFKTGTYSYEVASQCLDLTKNEKDTLSKDEQILQLSQNYAHHLEKYLRSHPEQWFNFYPFWSEKIF